MTAELYGSSLSPLVQAVLHRPDNPFQFFAAFARAEDSSTSLFQRSGQHFLRSCIAFHMFTRIILIKQALKPAEPDNFGDQYLFREYAILGMPSRALGDDFNVISHTVSCVCIDSQRAALTSRSNKSEIRE